MEAKEYIAGYIQRARYAQEQFEKYDQAGVDQVVRAIAKTVYDNAEMLAELAVEETGMGVVADKILKNKLKAKIIWNDLKDKKSVGIIERDDKTGITKVAKPKGVIAAITPTTNPTVTPMSNAMFALKGRNAIVITPHHRALKTSTLSVELINEALAKLGAPENLIQIIAEQGRENTRELIAAADTVIATGGMGMVKAAYSCGKPALGVGAGNVQCIIDQEVDYNDAVKKVVTGRTFDNGIICSAEQSVMVPRKHLTQIKAALQEAGAYLVEEEAELANLREALFPGGAMNKDLVGQSVKKVAEAVGGIELSKDVRLLAAIVEKGDLLGKEKMCPVLAVYPYDDFSEAVEIAYFNLSIEGKGHSVAIHSNSKEKIEYAAEHLPVSRFVINQCSATSAGGSFFNGFAPTNTLGCGSWGNNSISENLTYTHLINISRIGYYLSENQAPSDEEIWG